MSDTNDAFIVPPRLYTRKRKAPISQGFLDEDVYHQFSIYGEVHESMILAEKTAKFRDQKLFESRTPNKPPFSTALTRIKPLAVPHQSLDTTKHLLIVLDEYRRKQTHPFTDVQQAQFINTIRRLSTLTVAQHMEFIRLQQKYLLAQQRGLPAILALTAEENTTFSTLEELARQEQTQLRMDLERIAMQTEKKRYTSVTPPVDEWYNKILESCRNQVTHLYPRLFEPHIQIPLHTMQNKNVESSIPPMILQHVREVATCKGIFPILDEQELLSNPTDLFAPEQMQKISWEAISAYAMAETLMHQHACDVAISSSTLQALFGISLETSPIHYSPWIMPVKSRVRVVDGQAQRQLYVDRVLPRMEVSAREKIQETVRTVIHHRALRRIQPKEENTMGQRAYHIWQLGELKILVRTTTHVFFQTEANSDGSNANKRLDPVSLFIKPDYRPFDRDEQISRYEREQLWLHSWLRGHTTIVVGHIDPNRAALVSWSHHTLASLANVVDGEGLDPSPHFTMIHTMLTTLLSLSAGNYLVRPLHPKKESESWHLDILSAITNEANVAIEHILDLNLYVETCGKTSSYITNFIVPTWPRIPHRIPYTFRTGSYCLEFLLHGICSREANGMECDYLSIHLRQSGFWSFEDHSLVIKRVSKSNQYKIPRITPSFSFCLESRPLDLNDVSSRVVCPSPTCSLPHLTLHQVAEIIADDILRRQRTKRRHQKGLYKRRQQEKIYI